LRISADQGSRYARSHRTRRRSPGSSGPASDDSPTRRDKRIPSKVASISLAYSAAHALSLAALRRSGYRAANRYIVFQVLPHTLGVGPEVWRVLARCHDLRNRGEYEGDLYVDERLVNDLINACKIVASTLNQLPPVA
jgi:hypothetical protein